MGRLRGCLWFSAGLVVALLAGAVAFITLQRAGVQRTGEGVVSSPRAAMVVAARAIPLRSLLVAEDLELKELPVDVVPEEALRDLQEAVGKVTLVDLYPGEAVLAPRLLDPNVTSGDGRLALVLAEEEVLMAFPADDLMSRVSVLKPGDHVDLLFSLQFPTNRGLTLPPTAAEEGEAMAAETTSDEEQATFSLLQNVTVAAVVSDKQSAEEGEVSTPKAILLTVSPQDALLLKYARDAGGIMDIILRAPGAEQPFDTEPVDVDYMIHRYRIPTEVGR